MTTSFEDRARAIVGDRVRRGVSLAPMTTFKVGGPADFLIEVRSEPELAGVVACARECGVPVTVLGGGSNVLVSDRGVRGVVLRLMMTGLSQPAPNRVRAEAGVTINGLVRWTIGRGLASLEAWAGTPGTVGGAIYGNAHYGGRNIGELVSDVRLIDSAGQLATVPRDRMGFAYDTSRLQTTREVVVWAEFGVTTGGAEQLRAVARASLAHRKRTQPLASHSAGCVFQNPDPARDPVPPDVPASAGALVDRAGLKGHRIGGALISPLHANFFVNDAGATAADIRALIDLARTRVRDRFGVELREEVVCLGVF
jgi:UDP-N-acetylmuramate dehydrogenase